MPIFFKFKEGERFNHWDTLSILRINSPKFRGGLKLAPDAEIGQKEVFCEGLKLQYERKAGDFFTEAERTLVGYRVPVFY